MTKSGNIYTESGANTIETETQQNTPRESETSSTYGRYKHIKRKMMQQAYTGDKQVYDVI